MKLILSAVLVSLALSSAQPAKPNKECFENRPKVRPMQCCTGISAMVDESALATCTAKYPKSTAPTTEDGKSRGHRGGDSCIIECYLNQTSVYKNGALDKATALTVLGKPLDAPLKKTLATALDTCIATMAEYKKKPMPTGVSIGKKGGKGGAPKKPENGENNCGREAGFLIRCVEMEMYKNCPAGKKVTNADCTALVTYMDKCKFEKKH